MHRHVWKIRTRIVTKTWNRGFTCVQHHLNHQRPELSKVRLGHVHQDVALIVQHRPAEYQLWWCLVRISVPPEEGGHVVVLQHGPVVVHDGKVGVWLDVEVVGGASQVGTLNNPPDNKIWCIHSFCEFWLFSLRFGWVLILMNDFEDKGDHNDKDDNELVSM